MAATPKRFPDEEFIAKKAVQFVPEFEALAGTDPDRFRFRVARHIVVGYALYLSAVLSAVLLSMVAIFLAVVGRLFWLIGVAFGSLGSGIALLQFLRVSIPPPKGIAIAKEDAPQLHELVHRIVKETSAPAIDAILLVQETNASISNRYKNGLFGETSTTLLLGLPLLQLLSADEFRTVLHHEFAHSSGGHGPFAIWFSRAWESWSQLPLMEDDMGFAARLVLPPIFRWFTPKFAAYQVVLSRMHELAADRGARANAPDSKTDVALVRVELSGRFMKNCFWPGIQKGTRDLPRIPSAIYSRLPEFAATVSALDIQSWIAAALREKSAPLDSHPDLSTRLKALGASADADEWAQTIQDTGFAPDRSAASEYFGASLPRYEQELTMQWTRSNFLDWQEAYRDYERGRAKLKELGEIEVHGALSIEQQVIRARFLWALEGPEVAQIALLKIHTDSPDDAEAEFTLGLCQLALDNEAGIALIERTIHKAPPSIRFQGAAAIVNFLSRSGRNPEAVAAFERLTRDEQARQDADRERLTLSPQDSLVSHGLSSTVAAEISKRVASLEWVVEAYLFRKATRLSPDRPLYLLALKPHRKFLIPAFCPGMTAYDQVAGLGCYPGDTLFLILDRSQPVVRNKIHKIPHSLLFKR